jgi:NTP pyrophosphatase (non-canonical NTP hydrolase)
LKKHGNGKFISAHETLGVLTEEYDETINAVRNNSEGQIIQELFDVAQTAVFGVASMRVRG